MMRELIDRRRGKSIVCVQAAYEPGRKQNRAIAVNGGVTEISCDGISPVLTLNAFEVLRYFVEGFSPTEGLPTVRSAADGMR